MNSPRRLVLFIAPVLWLCATAFTAAAFTTPEQGTITVKVVDGVPLLSAPLEFRYFGYTRGAVANWATDGTRFDVLRKVQTPTLLGVQTFLEIRPVAALTAAPLRSLSNGAPLAPSGMSMGNKLRSGTSYWIAVSVADANKLEKDGTVVLRNSPRLELSDPRLVTMLFCLPFVAFLFGIYVRNTAFDSAGWRPAVQQILIAIPIALTTVSAEILGMHRLFVAYQLELIPCLAVFLGLLGTTAIQGILLQELSGRYIEARMRRRPRKSSLARRETATSRKPARRRKNTSDVGEGISAVA
jgi:hypothetical protein